MLSRSPLFVLTLGLSVASVACVVTTDDGSGGSGGGSTTSNTTSTSSQGGAGGEGGEGGATNGSGGAGGEGGGAACVAHTGVGVAEGVCATDVVGGLSCGTGNNEQPAPARLVCSRSFEIFTEGARENLIACLEEIPAVPADVCDEAEAEATIGACVSEMYAEACLNDASYLVGPTGVCAEADASCTAANDNGFPTDTCLADLNVFSGDGAQEYADCFNDSANAEVPCNQIHELCYDLVLSY
jgi:hypothetical protein